MANDINVFLFFKSEDDDRIAFEPIQLKNGNDFIVPVNGPELSGALDALATHECNDNQLPVDNLSSPSLKKITAPLFNLKNTDAKTVICLADLITFVGALHSDAVSMANSVDDDDSDDYDDEENEDDDDIDTDDDYFDDLLNMSMEISDIAEDLTHWIKEIGIYAQLWYRAQEHRTALKPNNIYVFYSFSSFFLDQTKKKH